MAKDVEETQKSQDTRGEQKETLKGSERYALSSGKFVLKDAIFTLRKMKNMKGPIGNFPSDGMKGRIMGYLVSIPEGGQDQTRFVLFGKGTDLYEEKVTIPQSMLFHAMEREFPLIGGLKFPDGEMEFYMFLPIWIFDGNYVNVEKYPYLVSFPFKLGERWDLIENIGSTMQRLKERYEKNLRQVFYGMKKKVRTLESFFPETDNERKNSKRGT